MIKSIMHYPKDKGFQEIAKNWIVSSDTWVNLRIELATYLHEIGETCKFPAGEEIEFLVAKGKVKKRNFTISDQDFEDLCETVKVKYPFLRDYQARDVVVYTTTVGILNANQMGLGKTIETGAYIDLEKPPNVLIVVPASLKTQWAKELKKFFPDLTDRIFVIKGTIKQRAKIWNRAFGRKNYIIITNYANLRTKDYIEFSLNQIEFDLLVFDEITKCKNHNTETFKMAEKLNGIIKVGLTGTPIENHITDIFNIMKLIHPFFFGAWSEFSREYFYKGGYQGKEYIEKPEAPRKIAEELREFMGWIRWFKEYFKFNISYEAIM
jgi:SNF2 family DNA or RNA helicase